MNTLKKILPYLPLAACLGFSLSAQAEEIRVNSLEDRPAMRLGDGASDYDGYCTLREAIDNANADAIIHFDCAAGRDSDVISLEGLSGVIKLNAALPKIIGSTHIRGPGSEVLTIDAQSRDYGIFRFVSDEGRPQRMSVRDLTLKNGKPGDMVKESNWDEEEQKEVVSFKWRSYGGGAIQSINNMLTVDSSVFEDNQGGDGGAIYAVSKAYGTSLIIKNSSFIDNLANRGDNTGNGGGVYSRYLYTANGDYVGAHSVLIKNSIFRGNIALTSGGGLYSYLSELTTTIEESRFEHNHAGNGLGGGISGPDLFDISSTAIYGNKAGVCGGGVFGDVRLINSTIAGNTAGSEYVEGQGAALCLSDSAPSGIVNTTITDNRVYSSNNVMGVVSNYVNYFDREFKALVSNSIIGDNIKYNTWIDQAPEDEHRKHEKDCANSIRSNGHNILDANGGCDRYAISTDTIVRGLEGVLDPVIVDNGDRSHAGDTHYYLLHIDADNPALNGGNPLGCYTSRYEPVLIDQTGAKRPEGEACEIGATEMNFW